MAGVGVSLLLQWENRMEFLVPGIGSAQPWQGSHLGVNEPVVGRILSLCLSNKWIFFLSLSFGVGTAGSQLHCVGYMTSASHCLTSTLSFLMCGRGLEWVVSGAVLKH